MDKIIGKLAGHVDLYRCLHINQSVLPLNLHEVLESSIPEYISQKLKAVWLLVPSSQLELVKTSQKFGFYPHHVNDSGIMMAKWLGPGPNSLPTYSTHFVGVGGLVFNDRSQILLVKNKQSGTGSTDWRIPGGLVNVNELINEAAVREVKEETDIDTNSLGVLGFREKKNYIFNRSDIYYLVLLEARNSHIKLNPEEILDCDWKDFHEFLERDKGGDVRKILRSVVNDNNLEEPMQWLKKFCLKYSELVYDIPNYHATHYFHLPNTK